MSETAPEYNTRGDEQRELSRVQAKELAAAYARLFLGSEDGKRVLADLRRKFGVDRAVFVERRDRFDAIAAALIDGQRQVLREIENALRFGAPTQQPTP